MVLIIDLPPEILHQICRHLFDHGSILSESPRNQQHYFPQTRPEEWSLDLLSTCRKLRDQGRVALKDALSRCTIIYRNCLPSPPRIRGHARVNDFSSDGQRSENFVRYYSYNVKEIQILGWPNGEICLHAFGKLETLTIGSVPIWLVPQDLGESSLDHHLAVSKLVEKRILNAPVLSDAIVTAWERDGRWTGGIRPWLVPERPLLQKICQSKKAEAGETRGKLIWRGKRTFNLHCRVVVDFNHFEGEPDRAGFITGTGLIDVDKAEVLEMKPGGHVRSSNLHYVD